MKKLIIIFLVIISSNEVFGHQDFYVMNNFGNVQTRIKTGYNFEQINIVKIIGKLSNQLSKELNYKGPIFLDFNHAYIENITPDYFISYGKGLIKYTWTKDKQKSPLKRSGIVVRQVSHEFDIETTLKLIEYSISNINAIKKNQNEITYEQNYCQWKIPSIDILEIQKILNHGLSEEINKVLARKTYLNSPDWNFGIDYFYQNREFHFLVKAYNGVKDTLALSTNSIFQTVEIDSGTEIVFESDSTFYCVGWRGNDRVISKQHYLKSIKGNFQTFKVKNIGDDLVSIHMSRFRSKEEQQDNDGNFYFEKTSIYDIQKDKLIDDIKEVIESKNE